MPPTLGGANGPSQFLIDDETFLHNIEQIQPEHPYETNSNLQRQLQNLIQEICKLAKWLEKIKASKMNSTIKSLINRRTKILQNVNPNNPERLEQALEIASSITKKLQEIQRICHEKNHSKSQLVTPRGTGKQILVCTWKREKGLRHNNGTLENR